MAIRPIYEQHEAAFRDVAAYVVVKDGKRLATVALKYPRDGAGRLYAYVHWIGTPMVRGFASGGGYDKATAACAAAAHKIDPKADPAFIAALKKDGGWSWAQALEQAGFELWRAL